MIKLIKQLGLIFSCLLVILVCFAPNAIAESGGQSPIASTTIVNSDELGKVVTEIENLEQMRSNLASFLENSKEIPTGETFKQVCKPVGMKAKQLSTENNWQVKQIASKYRNSTHKPDTLSATIALAKFQQDENLTGFWQSDMVNGEKGARYFRRINVQASCLACHGLKDNRPEFVKNNYPQDLAYNFKVGDLRGIYSVFIPQIQQALQ